MNFPQTYEDFLKMQKDDLVKLSNSKLSLNDALRLIEYCNKSKTERIKKQIVESNQCNNLWEEFGYEKFN